MQAPLLGCKQGAPPGRELRRVACQARRREPSRTLLLLLPYILFPAPQQELEEKIEAAAEADVDRIIDSKDNEYVLSKPSE